MNVTTSIKTLILQTFMGHQAHKTPYRCQSPETLLLFQAIVNGKTRRFDHTSVIIK